MEHPVEKNVLLLIETAASEHNPYVDNISFCWFFSIKLLFFFFFLGKQLVQLPDLSVISALMYCCSY